MDTEQPKDNLTENRPLYGLTEDDIHTMYCPTCNDWHNVVWGETTCPDWGGEMIEEDL